MKNIRPITKSDAMDIWIEMSNQQIAVPASKLSAGSLADKYPVVLDGGRTTIYISDKRKESETRKRYETRMGSAFIKSFNRPKS
jgi:hypothetical protein